MPTSRSWLGGGRNRASNPHDWTPSGAPQPGDTLNIAQGTINISGNDLARDVLNVAGPRVFQDPSALITINAHNRAVLHLNLVLPQVPELNPNTADRVDLNVSGTAFVDLGATSASTDLTTSGGSLHFIGGSTEFFGATQVFDSKLLGDQTITLFSGNHVLESMELGGYVAAGLTFDLMTNGPPLTSLQIDHPDQFHGLIDIAPGPVNFGYVGFMGLDATSWDIRNDVLRMFNGNKLVDLTRVTGNVSGLELQQNGLGVFLSAGGSFSSGDQPPGGPLTPIPLHT